MGYGHRFRCAECGEEYAAYLGTGMIYPQTYEKTAEDIAAGKHGEDLRQALELPYAAVDASMTLYVCASCGAWVNADRVAVLAPDDPEEAEREAGGDVKGPGGVRFATPWELSEGYHVVLEEVPACPGCGGPMHIASESEETELRCPACGAVNKEAFGVMWD